MNSDLPKVLHPLAGVPLIAHALAAARGIEPERTILVTGHGGDAVAAAAREFDRDLRVVEQAEQLGTGHAVLQAAPELAGFEGDAIVLYGDTPFVRPETLQAMLDARAAGAAVVVLGFEARRPRRLRPAACSTTRAGSRRSSRRATPTPRRGRSGSATRASSPPTPRR